MKHGSRIRNTLSWCFFTFCILITPSLIQADITRYSVRDYGATGKKAVNCRDSIQKAIDACASTGGGLVYFPAGDYLTGPVTLRSHVRIFLEAGATVYADRDKKVWTQNAIFYGAGLENITIEGRGTIDGQAEYEWALSRWVDPNIEANRKAIEKAGGNLKRAYPVAPTYQSIYLYQCRDVLVKNISMVRSPSWTFLMRECEQVVVEGVAISTSLTDGAWADGIDIDSCRNVHISNSTIATGDDAICLKAMLHEGRILPCENVTVTNCTLTSSSCAFKFGDEIYADVRHVLLDNCVIRDSNRGVGICLREKGNVSDVIISNVSMECTRKDWFWWGDGDPIFIMTEESIYQEGKKITPPGTISNILIKNVIAHVRGTSRIYSYAGKPHDGIVLDTVKILVTEDLDTLPRTVHGLECRGVRDLKLKDVEIEWGAPASPQWECAVYFDDIQGLELQGFRGRQAREGSRIPAVMLKNVRDAFIHDCKALPGTGEFFHFTGAETEGIYLYGNQFKNAIIPYGLDKNMRKNVVRAISNLMP